MCYYALADGPSQPRLLSSLLKDNITVASMQPAQGERRAISGYYAQYRIASAIILRHLQNDSLQWLRLADPTAGRVDCK